eukprot:gene13121-9396_t
MPVYSANLGFPRIGARRELKVATEAYWSGKIDQSQLLDTAKKLRETNWKLQRDAGVNVIPSNDFSLYDQMLDTAILFGVIPDRYKGIGASHSLDVYFAMARGRQLKCSGAPETTCSCGHLGHSNSTDVPAQEMTKWFDTNYHYIVPEVHRDQSFSLSPEVKPVVQYHEAKALGIETRPVIIGPITFLHLAKSKDPGFRPIELLPRLLPVYLTLFQQLQDAGVTWVQIDEPILVLDLTADVRAAFETAYDCFASALLARRTATGSGLQLMLATYFGGLEDNLDTALSLPVDGLHVDLVRAPEQLEVIVAKAKPSIVLSFGVVDGRNIWKADLNGILARLGPVVNASDRIYHISPSCSLLHTPVDLSLETDLESRVKPWLAFAKQKLDEIVLLAQYLANGNLTNESLTKALAENAVAIADRRSSPLTYNESVRQRMEHLKQHVESMTKRTSPFSQRRISQGNALQLPLFPTTTIGSFPQTAEVRKVRAAFDKGQIDQATYDSFVQNEIKQSIRWQEEIGLDVLVHGEFERNDMVQYFGEQLQGFTFSRYGWVQSYGSRCVRPPILYGDVSRPASMTVAWWKYAQSLTDRVVKGMLTGPVTILQWSFVRDDQSRADTCRQIGLAIRDEVLELEANGAKVIQIDEAALREGLPLRRAHWQSYLQWAVESFAVSASGVRDDTQIHTHMCYSEFNDIITAIADMDADVISIETARSQLELLNAFTEFQYPNDVGPGVYDIHSPRIPSVEEIVKLLETALHSKVLPSQLWVNPDCGLKTRKWVEVKPALVNMVQATLALRSAHTAATASATASFE